jgi:hypothetical protein
MTQRDGLLLVVEVKEQEVVVVPVRTKTALTLELEKFQPIDTRIQTVQLVDGWQRLPG